MRKRGQRSFPPLLLRKVAQQQRQLDVLNRIQHRNQVVELEDESDVPAAPLGQLAFRQRCEVSSGHNHLARRRAVDAGDQVQQRGLARARRPHQRQELALRHFEAQAVEHRDLLAIAVIDLAYVLHTDGASLGRHFASSP